MNQISPDSFSDQASIVLSPKKNGSAGTAQPSRIGGFCPKHPRLHTLYNRIIGSLLFLFAAPFLLGLTLLVLLLQGRPVFYGGERLGKDAKPFEIYKFRTLDTKLAQTLTADKVLPKDSNIETKLGKFLRASRLDELPQIWNIVRGDMNIVGPRPVRRPIAMLETQRNPHYSIRFSVKPGLIGPTQACMGHGTSKRLRARYNYMQCTARVSYLREIGLLVTVGLEVFTGTLRLIGDRLIKDAAEKRAICTAKNWDLTLQTPTHGAVPVSAFSDLTATLARAVSEGQAILVIRTGKGIRKAMVTMTRSDDSTPAAPKYAIKPNNDIAEHLISRYLAGDPVVLPKPAQKTRLRNIAKAAVGTHPIDGHLHDDVETLA